MVECRARRVGLSPDRRDSSSRKSWMGASSRPCSPCQPSQMATGGRWIGSPCPISVNEYSPSREASA